MKVFMSTAILVFTSLLLTLDHTQGLGDRCPDVSIDDIDDLHPGPKDCFDKINRFGDCLLDDQMLDEVMCRAVFGDKGYKKLVREQKQIDEKFARIYKRIGKPRTGPYW